MEQGTILLEPSAKNASGGYLEGKLEYTAHADPANNTQKITLKLYCRKKNDSMPLTVATAGAWHYTFKIGTLPVTGYTPSDTRVLSDFVLLARIELTLPCDENGLLSTLISASVTAPAGTLYEDLVTSGKQSVVFGQMQRVGKLLLASDCHFGGSVGIRVQASAEGFYYAALLRVGDFRSELFPICPASLSPERFSVPLPLSAASGMPNAAAGELLVSLLTFSDAERQHEIGRESLTVTAILDRSPDTLPTLEMTLSPVNPSLPEGLSQLYIEGITRVAASFKAEAKLCAAVESCHLTVQDSDDDLLPRAGQITVTGTVFDSRGFSALAQETISVLPYSEPLLTPPAGESGILLFRCDEKGAEDPSGQHLRLSADFRFSALDGVNTPIFRYRVRCEEDPFGAWCPLAGVENEILENAVPDVAASYTLELSVLDLVGNSHTVTLRVPTGAVTLHLGRGGRRAAFGKTAEIENALEIAPDWRLIVSGQPILDTVVAVSHDEERGVCMRKWNSGRCELFFSSRSFTPTAWGSLGSLHLGKCYLSLPVSLRDAIVQGGCRDHLFMGGNVSGSDLVFTVASGEAFTGTSEISASLFVCGMTEN